MRYPAINVSLINKGQGAANEIERHLLFIGSAQGASEKAMLLSANTQTDFDKLLGEADSALKTQLTAAMLNAGQNWTAGVWVLGDGQSWKDAAMLAQNVGSFEGVVVCDAVATKEDIKAAQTLHTELVTKWARWSFVMLNLCGLNMPEPAAKSAKSAAVAPTETWAEYHSRMTTIIADINAPGVMVVPPTHTNNLGCLAGRLCNRSASIADSPMRVKTGALVGLGAPVLDSAGNAIDSATRQAMADNRFNVIATFPDYPGEFWADGCTLDAPGGDFQSIENLRVLMKAARRVRLVAIPKIADRGVNDTPSSMAATRSEFAKPLREMSRGITVGTTYLPGEIEPPGEDAVSLNWKTRDHLEMFITATPYNSPKAISIGLALNLSK